jgi:hypothetical protein
VSHDETQKDKAQALKNLHGLGAKRKKLSREILAKLQTSLTRLSRRRVKHEEYS